MFEIIKVATAESVGIFAFFRKAEEWVKAHGDPEDFRILPW